MADSFGMFDCYPGGSPLRFSGATTSGFCLYLHGLSYHGLGFWFKVIITELVLLNRTCNASPLNPIFV